MVRLMQWLNRRHMQTFLMLARHAAHVVLVLLVEAAMAVSYVNVIN